eukprot:scaffold338_cov361-Pavlova_lutheri.AAC.8
MHLCGCRCGGQSGGKRCNGWTWTVEKRGLGLGLDDAPGTIPETRRASDCAAKHRCRSIQGRDRASRSIHLRFGACGVRPPIRANDATGDSAVLDGSVEATRGKLTYDGYGAGVEFSTGPFPSHLPFVQEDQSIHCPPYRAVLMGDHHVAGHPGRSAFVVYAPNEIFHHRRSDGIQSCRGFVVHDHFFFRLFFFFSDDGPGQGHPLLHPPAELGGIFLLHAAQSHAGQALGHELLHFLFFQPIIFLPQGESHVLSYGQGIEQGCALEDHPDAQLRSLLGHVFVVHESFPRVSTHQHVSIVRCEQSCQHFQHRGFSRS